MLIVLQVKHFFSITSFQTLYMLRNKGTYFHPGGILHAGLHALGTIAAFFVVTPTLRPRRRHRDRRVPRPLPCRLVEGADHQAQGYTAVQREFWWAIGADQLIHHLTYIGIAVILVTEMERAKGGKGERADAGSRPVTVTRGHGRAALPP